MNVVYLIFIYILAHKTMAKIAFSTKIFVANKTYKASMHANENPIYK